jgi:hypothetical protein
VVLWNSVSPGGDPAEHVNQMILTLFLRETERKHILMLIERRIYKNEKQN